MSERSERIGWGGCGCLRVGLKGATGSTTHGDVRREASTTPRHARTGLRPVSGHRSERSERGAQRAARVEPVGAFTLLYTVQIELAETIPDESPRPARFEALTPFAPHTPRPGLALSIHQERNRTATPSHSLPSRSARSLRSLAHPSHGSVTTPHSVRVATARAENRVENGSDYSSSSAASTSS